MEQKVCESCRHWSGQGLLLAADWGRCARIGHADEMRGTGEQVAVVSAGAMHKASLDTHKAFGCVLWERSPVSANQSEPEQAVI